jgi:ribosomal protein S18 acetylase RimI-like enzyme
MGIRVAPLDPGQKPAVEAILRAATPEFSEEEIRAALDMVEAALAGGYYALAAVDDTRLAGYCLAGPAPLTDSTWHLYWLCVDPEFRRQGVAAALQSSLESTVRECGGERIVVETAGRAEYLAARAFYRANGYEECGSIPDYYRQGDSCILLCKVIQ